MTERVAEIWVADWVRALDAVGDDPDVRRDVARLLGFGAPDLTPAPRPEPASCPAAPAAVAPDDDLAHVSSARHRAATGNPLEAPPLPPPPPSQPPPASPPPPAHTDRLSPGAPTRLPEVPVLEPVGHDDPDVTDWALVDSLDEVTERHLRVRPPLEPLLTTRSSAAILNAALTTPVRDDGEPDIEALVDFFARGIPPTRLPRAPRPTLRFGVQVLVDMGEAMQPYRRDQRELVRQITGLVGAELTQVRYFADVPARGVGPGGRGTWQPYRTPSQGTRVLLVSDLGVGGPFPHRRRASVAEWYDVLDEIVRAGCTALALVPYPVDRVPAELARLLSALTWDRTTTVSTVAALVGRRP
ncbi:hypothetical protein ACHBTE_17530 [Streptomyces sp. M41]|uniref:hypothetical protein n=1 Tax=Streptomyces sp. M41 TaxID=3059412 RepID=UPI00374DA213